MADERDAVASRLAQAADVASLALKEEKERMKNQKEEKEKEKEKKGGDDDAGVVVEGGNFSLGEVVDESSAAAAAAAAAAADRAAAEADLIWREIDAQHGLAAAWLRGGSGLVYSSMGEGVEEGVDGAATLRHDEILWHGARSSSSSSNNNNVNNVNNNNNVNNVDDNDKDKDNERVVMAWARSVAQEVVAEDGARRRDDESRKRSAEASALRVELQSTDMAFKTLSSRRDNLTSSQAFLAGEEEAVKAAKYAGKYAEESASRAAKLRERLA